MPDLRVIHRSSVLKGRELTLRDPAIRLGRDPSCQILFDENADRIVSRLHAEIRWTPAGPVLTPSPGRLVFVNGTPLNGATRLSSGDLIELAVPGGPSIEIRFDGGAPRVAAPEGPPAEARTLLEHVPDALRWNVPSSLAPKTIVPRLPPPEDPVAINSPAPQFGTRLLSAVDAIGEIDPAAGRQSRPTRRWLIPAAAVILVVVAAVIGWLVHAHKVRVRSAVANVEAMLAAERTSGVAQEVSEEDLRLFEEEVAAKRHAPPTIPLHAPRPARPARAKTTGLDAEPAALKPVRLSARENVARAAFAVYQRARIARFELGKPHDRHGQEQLRDLVATVRAAETAYDAAAQAVGSPGDATDQAIRRTARALGECDAAIPRQFLQEARAAIEELRNSPAQLDALTAALKRADDYRYGPTITAALADQQLPVELFFIPAIESDFDPSRVAPIGERGIAKGMWQLLPQPAEAMGLRPGRAAASFDRDLSDDREQYQREVRLVAGALRPIFLHRAAGSALLLMATYDHGNEALLEAVRQQAGIAPGDVDPADVSFWRTYESDTVSEAVRQSALNCFATAAISMSPAAFGLSFTPPLEHVSLAESE